MSSGGGGDGSASEYLGHNKHRLLSTRVFESGPPLPLNHQEVLSTIKTEELTKKKKTDTLITKQIETRVRREIVVTDDGEILEDSGPTVITETTENTRTEEQENTESKTSGPDDPGPGWTLVPGSKVISETKKKNETKNDTREERTNTEIIEEIGGLSREEITKALKQREQAALKARRDSSSTCSPAPSRSHQVLHHSSHKVVDTEETDEVSEYKDGAVTTQTKKKSNREESFDGDNDRGRWPSTVMSSKVEPVTTTTEELGSSRLRVKTTPSNPARPSSTETFNWVNHHFGSQDELDGHKVSVTTTTSNHIDRDVVRRTGDENVDDEDDTSSQRKVHYTRRQQMPLNTGPVKPLRCLKKSTEHSAEHRQYFLGEDPGVGQRFTGMTSSPDSGRATLYSTQSLGKPSKTRIVPTEFSTPSRGDPGTLGVDEAVSPPSVNDIIHSLRSKAFLEKENAAVSIRDDDSTVYDNRSTLYRPLNRPLKSSKTPVKQHVIKISIRSDDSDCSSPTASTANRSSFEFGQNIRHPIPNGNNGGGEGAGIVKNAINNLLKNRLNTNESSRLQSPNGSAYSSLSRNSQNGGRVSNLKSTKTYLTASSPNVNKIHEPPREIYVQRSTTTTAARPPPKSSRNIFNGNRSQSIGNLNNGYHHHHDHASRLGSPMSSGYGTYSSSRDGVTRMNVGDSTVKSQGRRQSPDYYCGNGTEKEDLRRSSYKFSVASPVWSSSGGSPPSSPAYTNRIKLPSPIPPSRGSSSSPSMSPRSPPPPLTRPYSPTGYNNNYNKYERRSNDEYHSKASLSSRVRGPSAWVDQSRSSSSSPPFYQHPPSPVLPARSTSGSVGGDDAASNASTNRSSHSTNPGSLEGAVPNPKDRLEVSNRKKVTTTTVKKREVELPDTDYYYDRAIANGNLGSKSRSIVQVGLRNNWNGC